MEPNRPCAEEQDNIVHLTDEDGEEIAFEFLDAIEYEGKEYVFLLPVKEDDHEIVILEVIESGDGGEDTYTGIENMELDKRLYQIFKDKFKDEFDFVD